jgi:chromosome segregation ATPase
VALLTGQLASVEQGRSRATGKLATLRKESASTLTTEIMADATIAGSMPASDSELDTLRERIAMLERERDAARAELAVLRARPPPPSIEPLQAQIAGLEAERVTLVGRQTELETALANARNEAAAARAASTAAGVEIEQLKAQLAHPVLASPAVPPAELHQQLEVTLTELKERDQKLDEIRRRNSELERFIACRVPTPIAAPR